MHLKYVNLADLLCLTNLNTLSVKDVSNGIVELIEGNQRLINLTLIRCSMDNAPSLSLKYLKKLSLQGMKEIDLSNLASTDLEQLEINDVRRIKKIGSISLMSKLKRLNLSQISGIDSLSDIESCTNLEYLSLSYLKNVSELSVLKRFEKLKCLNIHCLDKVDPETLRDLAQLPKLEELTIYFDSRKKQMAVQEIVDTFHIKE